MTDQSDESVKGHVNSTKTGKQAVSIDRMPKHIDVSTGLFPLTFKSHCLFHLCKRHFLSMVKQQAVKCQPD